MNRTKILPAVELTIKNRGASVSKWFWLCYRDGRICCDPGGLAAQPEIWFCKLTTKQIDDGLTSSEWSAIESRIYNLLNQKGML